MLVKKSFKVLTFTYIFKLINVLIKNKQSCNFEKSWTFTFFFCLDDLIYIFIFGPVLDL